METIKNYKEEAIKKSIDIGITLKDRSTTYTIHIHSTDIKLIREFKFNLDKGFDESYQKEDTHGLKNCKK